MEESYFYRWASANGSDYKFTEIFVYQEPLCLKYPQQFEPSGINVLTTRLCLAQEAFVALYKLQSGYRQRITENYKENETGRDVSGMRAPSLIPRAGHIGEEVKIPLIEPHKNLYTFCSFMVSTLDRLAVEINLLYNLKIPEDKIDWGKFGSDRNGKKKEGSICLANKNRILEQKLVKFNFTHLIRYRNILEHRGFLELKLGVFGPKFDFFIPDDPDSKISNFSTPITEYCKKQFLNVLQICNDIYLEIYKDAKSKNFNFPIR